MLSSAPQEISNASPIAQPAAVGCERDPAALLVRVRDNLGRQAPRALWAGTLLLAIVLALASLGIISRVQEASCPDGLRDCLPEHEQLVRSARLAFGVEVLGVALVLLIYVLTFGSAPIRRFYRGALPWAVHWGWSVAALGWVGYAALGSLLGVAGDPRVESLRLVGPTLLALVCFLHGTHSGAEWRNDTQGCKRLAALFGAGFLVFALTELLTFEATGEAVRQVREAFAHLDPGREYWLQPKTNQISSYLDSARWLLLAYVYFLSARTMNDLPAFFRRCPIYPPRISLLGAWLLARREVLYAAVPALAAAWLFGSGWLAAQTAGGSPSQGAQSAGRALALLPAYVLLMVPAVGSAYALATAQCGGRVMTGARRSELLEQTRYAFWLLFLVAGLAAGNLFVWADDLRLPLASGLVQWVATLAPSFESASQQGQFMGFVAVAFCASLLHYVGLVELPYYRGQSRWKTAEVERSRAERQSAERALTERVAEADPPGSSGGTEEMTARLLARYTLAREQAQAARDIPLHTFKNAADLVRKIGNKLSIALLAGLLGSEQPGNDETFRSLLQDIVRMALGG